MLSGVRYALLIGILPLFLNGADITDQKLRTAQSDAATWLTYGKNYAGWRYADLAEIKRTLMPRQADATLDFSNRRRRQIRDHAARLRPAPVHHRRIQPRLRPGRPDWTPYLALSETRSGRRQFVLRTGKSRLRGFETAVQSQPRSETGGARRQDPAARSGLRRLTTSRRATARPSLHWL